MRYCNKTGCQKIVPDVPANAMCSEHAAEWAKGLAIDLVAAGEGEYEPPHTCILASGARGSPCLGCEAWFKRDPEGFMAARGAKPGTLPG